MTGSSTEEKPHDIYGQDHPDETPDLIQRKQKEFDEEVEARKEAGSDEIQCLVQAQEECPELLTKEFKLKFLRCQQFKVDLAVNVYQKYWRKRVKVFGKDRAFKPLTLDSFSAEERVALEHGYVTLLPNVTDAKGRAIVYIDPSRFDEKLFSRMSLCRAAWYVQHAALEEELTQRYGQVVLIDTSRSSYSDFDRKLCKVILPSMMGAMPGRTAGFHFMRASTIISTIIPLVKMFFTARLQNRFLVHPNHSDKKLLKGLKKFGLHDEAIPTSLGGTLEVDTASWLEARQQEGL